MLFADGRYDTPDHSLFRSLAGDHKDDFYQPCEPNVKSATGPRLPWQDIHAKLEGPAARDVMVNFVERYVGIHEVKGWIFQFETSIKQFI